MQTETKGLFLFTQPSLKTSSCKPLLLFEGNVYNQNRLSYNNSGGSNSAINVNTINRL